MNDCSPSRNRGPSQAFTRWLGARRDLPELGPVRGRTGSGAGTGMDTPRDPAGGRKSLPSQVLQVLAAIPTVATYP